jgi:hypothetical protein
VEQVLLEGGVLVVVLVPEEVERMWEKNVEEWMLYKYCAYMCVNGKKITVDTILGIGIGEGNREWWRG